MKRLLFLFITLIMLFTSCSAPLIIEPSFPDTNADELFSQLEKAQAVADPENEEQDGNSKIAKIDSLTPNNVYAANTANENQLSFIGADGKAAYKIVYPQKTIEIIHDAAEVLRVALKEATGKNFKKQSDATADSTNEYEILIGDTNRTQSKHTLKEKEYSIKVDGNNIESVEMTVPKKSEIHVPIAAIFLIFSVFPSPQLLLDATVIPLSIPVTNI